MIRFQSNGLMEREISIDEMIQRAPAIGATEPAGHVSNRYTFVPTTQAINRIQDLGWQPIHAEQANSRIKGGAFFAPHLVVFQHPEMIISEGEKLQMLLRNSHNAGSSFQLSAGIFRLICSNGTVSGSDIHNASHIHKGFSDEDFFSSVVQISKHAWSLKEDKETYEKIEMTPDEQGIYAQAIIHATYSEPETAPVRPDQLLIPRRTADTPPDLWRTMNKVQENRIKGGLRGQFTCKKTGKVSSRKTRAVKSISENVKINQAIDIITRHFADLKTS